jgi:hypothetical protein
MAFSRSENKGVTSPAACRTDLARIARRHGRTVSQVVSRFALDVSMAPLAGATDADHAREDLHLLSAEHLTMLTYTQCIGQDVRAEALSHPGLKRRFLGTPGGGESGRRGGGLDEPAPRAPRGRWLGEPVGVMVKAPPSPVVGPDGRRETPVLPSIFSPRSSGPDGG